MSSSGLLSRVTLLIAEFSEERTASIISVRRINEIRTTLTVILQLFVPANVVPSSLIFLP
jgi:hypothetical protein